VPLGGGGLLREGDQQFARVLACFFQQGRSHVSLGWYLLYFLHIRYYFFVVKLCRLEEAVVCCEKAINNSRGFLHAFFSKGEAMCLLAGIFCIFLHIIYYFCYFYREVVPLGRGGGLLREGHNNSRGFLHTFFSKDEAMFSWLVSFIVIFLQ
jgi:hypothetical protein